MAIDFSDLGATEVQPAQKGLDFSDLGGQKVSDGPQTQTAHPPQDTLLNRVADFDKNYVLGLPKKIGNAVLGPQTMNNIGQAAEMASNNPAIAYSPQGLLQKGFGVAQQAFSKAGDYVSDAVTKTLQQPNASIIPESTRAPIAAAAGTLTKMTPDILSSFGPLEAASEAKPMFQSYLENKAQKTGAQALGYSKKFLGNPENLQKARSVAQTMLDQGVITPMAGAEKMAQRASDLADQSGEAIGSYLTNLNQHGNFFNPQEAISDLENLRPMRENGQPLMGGAFDRVNNKIDNAIQTIKAYGDEPISWKEANDLKGTLQDLANWKSNKDATILDKVIAGKFRSTLDNSLDKFSQTPGQDPQAFQDFLKNKKVYSAALNAQDPLYNRISSELGNKSISLTDFILAAPEIATGNWAKAAALIGGKKLFQKFGPQTSASLFNKLAQGGQSAATVVPGETNVLLNESAPNTSPSPLFQRPNLSKKFPQAAQAPQQKNDQLADVTPTSPLVTQPDNSDYEKATFTVPRNAKAIADKKQAKAFFNSASKSQSPEAPKPSSPPTAIGATRAEAPQPKKYLDEKTARMYLKKADGDKQIARAMAQDDGWTVV